VPGTMLAQRFRIVSMLGRGGMGEVYRADDLELGQPVALKFLPQGSLADSDALERFRAEVRNAREVAHPNVCRMYDIGEYEGRTFLSMEYVDGEDLASLLRRIGQLPRAKANEIGHQVCAGLAAAHARGVVHRDLKPSNILIDSRGQAHLTDFGLAVRAEDGTREMAGTPAYMAPEQFNGEPATAQTDLYALGLVLYELYTGKRPFDANSVETWKKEHSQTIPRPPTELNRELDPTVETIVLRCLEKKAQKRPASALAVAAALPGGNALAAVLAAGETPSPELVAASGEEGVLSAARAALLTLAIVLAAVALVFLMQRGEIANLSAPGKSAEYLADHARDLAARLGGSPPVADSTWWFQTEPDGFVRLGALPVASRYREMRNLYPGVLWFVYRQSPRPLDPDFPNVVSALAPVPFYTGDTRVTLDPAGRLLQFNTEPPQRVEKAVAEQATPAVDWQPFFAAAELDLAKLQSVPATWIPEMPANQQFAWQGENAGQRFLVEAAAFHGQPVYFRVLSPETRPLRMLGFAVSTAQKVGANLFTFAAGTILVFCAFYARRNILNGRGDRRGALRASLLALIFEFLTHFFIAHHISDPSAEWNWFEVALGHACSTGLFFGIFYLALEPYIRRGWPEILVSWSRLLSGGFRNALVGRDLLIGILLGLLLLCLGITRNALPGLLGVDGFGPINGTQYLGPLNLLLGGVFGRTSANMLNSVGSLAILFVGWRLTKSKLVSAIIVAAFWTAVSLTGPNFAVEVPLALGEGLAITLCLTRVGFFPLVVGFVVQGIFAQFPLTVDLNRWYATRSIAILAVLAGFVAYGFWVASGGKWFVEREET